jgi:probable HAF family extracellular repeat protein
MRDLLPGDPPPAGPASINARGDVASTRGPLSVFMANPRPYLWSERDGVTEIGALPGGNGAVARGLNDHGQVVGEADAPGPGATREMHAFLWSRHEGMRSLGVVGPVPSGAGAKDVNNRGHVVGVRILDAAPSPSPTVRGFLWTPRDGFMELHAPGAMRTIALAINERDQVVGVLVTSLGPPQVMRAFLWSRTGGFVVLPELSSGDTQALAINDAGVVAGHSRAPDGRLHAVVWKTSGQP